MPSKNALMMFDRAGATNKHEFGSFFLSRLLGFDIKYRDDTCRVHFDVTPELTNPMGSLHGGVLATALDVSMGHLIFYSYGSPGATVEMKVHYLASVTAGEVVCEARYMQDGRSLKFLQSEARIASSGKVVAFATATWKIVGTAAIAQRDT